MNSNLVEIESATENAFIEGELKIIHGHGTYTIYSQYSYPL